MKNAYVCAALALSFALVIAGCNQSSPPKQANTAGSDKKAADKSASKSAAEELEANLAKLSPEDRKLAEAQRLCPVSDQPLGGSMGVPVKLTMSDQVVFICCDHCKKEAEKDADKTLAKVKALKEKTTAK
jgi:hypothetical protein